jgi:hypothetical protein
MVFVIHSSNLEYLAGVGLRPGRSNNAPLISSGLYKTAHFNFWEPTQPMRSTGHCSFKAKFGAADFAVDMRGPPRVEHPRRARALLVMHQSELRRAGSLTVIFMTAPQRIAKRHQSARARSGGPNPHHLSFRRRSGNKHAGAVPAESNHPGGFRAGIRVGSHGSMPDERI